MRDVKELMRDHYLRYASYVILDRAIPDLADGLKPVQRRILHTLYRAHDGKFHKVANMVGQTMAYHPHGDAPIYEALVTLANKGFLLDCQGNFGNIYTGDSAAAARYIETRLSKLALETMFNPRLTEYVSSYDGRNQEPVLLPAKIPLLLMQGAEGIAVGMATKIFPHNFQEVLKAEIQLLKGRSHRLYPDFPTGGLMDVSDYDNGKGKIRLRCVIEEKGPKTIVIREICASTSTESVIASIEEAAKKGKIKIESIHDYTAEEVEIEIHLPRSVYAKDVIDQLYAFTECEVSLVSQMVVIADGVPREITVSEALQFYVDRLQAYLKSELELELSDIKKLIFEKNLERIFIEHKIYQSIEEVEVYERVYDVLSEGFEPYHKELLRPPVKEDFDMLLKIPIRRIAKFDLDKNRDECRALEEREAKTLRLLSDIPAFAMNYLEDLLKRYGSQFRRRTTIQDLEVVDKREMERKEIEVGVDREHGYIGTKVAGPEYVSCTNFDRLLVLLSDGTYKVVHITDRLYVAKTGVTLAYCGVADKQQIFTCCYRNIKTGLSFCKRFIVKQFIIDREYRFLSEDAELLHVATNASPFLVQLVPKQRQRLAAIEVNPETFPIRGVASHGARISSRPVLAVSLKKKSSSP
jgi:topoisomerase-4 subunit A